MMEDVESRYKFSRGAGHAGLSEFTKKDHRKALESPRASDMPQSKGLMVVNNPLNNLNSSNHRWTDAH